jgi:hypothetical protein
MPCSVDRYYLTEMKFLLTLDTFPRFLYAFCDAAIVSESGSTSSGW